MNEKHIVTPLHGTSELEIFATPEMKGEAESFEGRVLAHNQRARKHLDMINDLLPIIDLNTAARVSADIQKVHLELAQEAVALQREKFELKAKFARDYLAYAKQKQAELLDAEGKARALSVETLPGDATVFYPLYHARNVFVEQLTREARNKTYWRPSIIEVCSADREELTRLEIVLHNAVLETSGTDA